jgi:HTH-type transcriptional regulator, competence development regulator
MESAKIYEKLISLIKMAQGDRSLNQFALNCNVNAGHLSRILNGKFVNPPKPDFLKKIAEHSYNNVTYPELMNAAGYLIAEHIKPIGDLVTATNTSVLSKDEHSLLNKKDEKDVEKLLNSTMEYIENQEGLMLNGEILDDQDIELLKQAIKNGLEYAKISNKKRFTPKKYRKDNK